MKKLLSIILTLTMLFSITAVVSVPTTANAASKRSKAIKAYKKYLKKEKYNCDKFALIYLDNNKIPELLTRQGSVVGICTYYKGKVIDTYHAVNLNKGNGKFTYYKKTGIYQSLGYTYGTWYESYPKLSKAKVKTKIFSTGNFSSSSVKYYKGEINGKKTKITKSKYKALLKKYKKGKKGSKAKFYSNTKASRKKHCK